MLKFVEDLLQGAPVEWKTLGEVAVLKRGKVYSKKYISENSGEFPLYSSQTTNNGILGEINSYDYDGNFLTWTTDGAYAGTIFHRKGKFSITNICGLIQVRYEQLNIRFLFYWLSIEAKKFVHSGMGNPKLMSNQIAKINIPIPPLYVQEKIVEILDKFTELEAELEARAKQYEYYRNKLLTFGEEVERKTLGEVSEISTGVSNRKDEVENGKYPLYVRSKNILRSDCYQFDETAIIIPGEGGIGEIFHYAVGKYALHQRAYRVHIHDEKLLDKFVFYYLVEHFKEYIVSISYNATVSSIRKPMLAELLIPLPPLHVQEKIVSILDKFHTLTNSLTEGLPREIALRHKQYEYYRDQLLAFPRPQ